MKSIFTNGETTLCKKYVDMKFKDKTYTVLSEFYRCCDTSQEFETAKQASDTMKRLYDEAKHVVISLR